MSFVFVSLFAAAIGCSDAVSPEDGLTAKALGLTEVTTVAGSGDPVLLANFSNPSLCLTAGRSGDQAFIASCDDESAAQILTWKADGAITTGDGLCLEASGARNGDPVAFSGCTGASAQAWSASSDEHIVSASGACLDLARRGGGGNGAVAWSCSNRDTQGWGARAQNTDGATGDRDDNGVAEVIVSPDAHTLDVDGTVHLAAETLDADGNAVDAGPPRWSSSNTSVATVREGLVSAVSSGTATISATVDGVTGTADVTVESSSTGTSGTASAGIWISAEEIARLPTSGEAWEGLRRDAARDPGEANIADQGSSHDRLTLAAALVCARTGEFCAKARQNVFEAIGTEEDARWLAVGRNLSGYVIAADLLGLRADGNPSSDGTRVEQWIEGWLTKKLPSNNSGELRPFTPFRSGSNASAQEGFAFAAVAAYLGDRAALTRAWDAFRTYACDPGAPDHESINLSQAVRSNWVHDNDRPCAVNPKGSVREVESGLPGAGRVHRLDGAIGNDMRRGGDFQWEPGWTQYPWTGLVGFVPAAVVLHRAGFPAFDVADQAVLRTHEYLWYLRMETGEFDWFNERRGSEVVQLVNHYYGRDYPVQRPLTRGHTVAYTDWTHPTK